MTPSQALSGKDEVCVSAHRTKRGRTPIDAWSVQRFKSYVLFDALQTRRRRELQVPLDNRSAKSHVSAALCPDAHRNAASQDRVLIGAQVAPIFARRKDLL